MYSTSVVAHPQRDRESGTLAGVLTILEIEAGCIKSVERIRLALLQ